jgi:hypothetical protein
MKIYNKNNNNKIAYSKLKSVLLSLATAPPLSSCSLALSGHLLIFYILKSDFSTLPSMREYYIRRDLSLKKLVQLKGCGVKESHCKTEIYCCLIEKSSLASCSSRAVCIPNSGSG